MRDFFKSLFSFSWALSLFSVRQLGDILNPRSRSQDPSGAAGTFDSVTQAMVGQFGPFLRGTFDMGDRLQRQLVDATFGAFERSPRSGGGGSWPADPAYAMVREPTLAAALRQDPREEVFLRYVIGTGTVSRDGRHIILKGGMYALNGERDGYHHGVLQARFRDPSELTPLRSPPQEPLDEPSEVVPADVRGDTKARWFFGDGSTLTGVGPALAEVVTLRDGVRFLFVPVMSDLTGGTGRFEGARGVKTALGSTFLAPGTSFAPGATIPIRSVEAFKVIRSRDLQPDSASSAHGCESAGNMESHSLEVFGSKMHYVEGGAGDPILFVHGNPTSSYLWRNVAPHLTSSGRCICPDLIGMGNSDKPAIEYRFRDHVRYLDEFIRKLGLRNLFLVLQDWGGPLGFHYAARHQSNVKGIAFMESLLRPYPSWDDFPARGDAPHLVQLRELFRRFRTGGVDGEGWQLLVDQNFFVERVLLQVAGRPLTDAEISCYRAPFRTPRSRRPIWRWAKELPIAGRPADVYSAAARFSKWLQRSRIPKLLFHATPGAVLSAQDAEWAVKNFPNLEVVHCGPGLHLLPETNPDLIGAELARWVAKVSRKGRPSSAATSRSA